MPGPRSPPFAHPKPRGNRPPRVAQWLEYVARITHSFEVAGRILVIDDDLAMCQVLERGLARRGFQVTTFTAPADALEALTDADFDVVVTDLKMKGMSGIALCERVVANRPDVPVVVITAFGNLETAVAAIRAGAYDFVTKPLDVDTLTLTLKRARQRRGAPTKLKRFRNSVAGPHEFGELLGASPAMKTVYRTLTRVAGTDSSVLITGESGTGKEVVARALHRRGRRSRGPFVAFNCSAMPGPLLESELFGHAKGAFTDAKTARGGLFVKASGGTLFLDEVGAMPMALQPKLLRALQERVVRPVGSDDEVPFQARLLASTNRDLEAAVKARGFREDLFFRINVIHVEMPPLRARGSDVLLLAQHFLVKEAARAGKEINGISPAAGEKLLAYSWPGNVRELQNCIERATAMTRFNEIDVHDLPERVRTYRSSQIMISADDLGELVPMEEVERRYVLHVLEAVGGSRSRAAAVLGFDRKTLYRKLERYRVDEDAS